MVVNVEKLLKEQNGDFSKFVKKGEMLKNVGENIKKNFALIFFYTQDIKNITFNPKFYLHFLPYIFIFNIEHVRCAGTPTPAPKRRAGHVLECDAAKTAHRIECIMPVARRV